MASNEQMARFIQALAAAGLRRSIIRRYDRCCHGGVIAYRLPLAYRLLAANGGSR